MPLFDLPLEQLRGYTSSVAPPPDLAGLLGRHHPGSRGPFRSAATFEPVENHLTVIDTFDVRFAGYGGAPIKGWLHLPANRPAGSRLPVVVQYIGYSGGRGLVNQDTRWAQAGYAQFIMDTRGQGYGGITGRDSGPAPVRRGRRLRRADDPGRRQPRGLLLPARVCRRVPCRGGGASPTRRWMRRAWCWPESARAAASWWPWQDWRPEGSTASSPRCPTSRSCRTFPASIDIAPRGPYPEIAAVPGPAPRPVRRRCWRC